MIAVLSDARQPGQGWLPSACRNIAGRKMAAVLHRTAVPAQAVWTDWTVVAHVIPHFPMTGICFDATGWACHVGKAAGEVGCGIVDSVGPNGSTSSTGTCSQRQRLSQFSRHSFASSC